MPIGRAHPRPCFARALALRSRHFLLALAALTLCAAASWANPRRTPLDGGIRQILQKWSAAPTAETERWLTTAFAAFGLPIESLDATSARVLEASFDDLAPLMVAAQTPPHPPQPSLQHFYRLHCDSAQANAMKSALRRWLLTPAQPMPEPSGGLPVPLPPTAHEAQAAAAELLGDWGDVEALPMLDAYAGSLTAALPRVSRAASRIREPARALPLFADTAGRLAWQRPYSDLDSVVVIYGEAMNSPANQWVADTSASRRIWLAVDASHIVSSHETGTATNSNLGPLASVRLSFRGGATARLERDGPEWIYFESGRDYSRMRVLNATLLPTIVSELRRAGRSLTVPRLVEETVRLDVSRQELAVVGTYWFEGSPPSGVLFFEFPIATDSGLLPPEWVWANAAASGSPRTLPASSNLDGSLCRIAVTMGRDTACKVIVRYKQKVTERTATYLTRTARSWGAPLRRATFEVRVDDLFLEGQPQLPPEFRLTADSAGHFRYFYEAAPYWPKRDITVRW